MRILALFCPNWQQVVTTEAAALAASDAEVARDLDQRLFAQVAAAVDQVAAGIEVISPGLLLLPAQTVVRHYGGESEAAQVLIDAVADYAGFEAQVGIADGALAAVLAAKTNRFVKPGKSALFLAPFAVSTLLAVPVALDEAEVSEFISVLERLGIGTLGEFARLDNLLVRDRFGLNAQLLHFFATGHDRLNVDFKQLDQPLRVQEVFATPLDSAQQIGFASRQVVENFKALLKSKSLVCGKLRITLGTVSGEQIVRVWRDDGSLSVKDILDRVRWQCDAYLSRRALTKNPKAFSAVERIEIEAVQIVAAADVSTRLWGDFSNRSDRLKRSIDRIRSLGGENAARKLIPAPELESLRPRPSRIFRPDKPVFLTAVSGDKVCVGLDGTLNLDASHLVLPAQHPAAKYLFESAATDFFQLAIKYCSLPHLLGGTWWDGQPTAFARMYVQAESGHAFILTTVAGASSAQWQLEGLYD